MTISRQQAFQQVSGLAVEIHVLTARLAKNTMRRPERSGTQIQRTSDFDQASR